MDIRKLLIFIMFFMLLPTVYSDTQSDLNDKAIMKYHLSPNGTNENVTQVSGVLTGSVYTTTGCKMSGAGCFYGVDGNNDHVDFTTVATGVLLETASPLAHDYTTCIWVNLANLPSGEFAGLFVTNDGSTSNDGWFIGFYDPDGGGEDLRVEFGIDSTNELWDTGWTDYGAYTGSYHFICAELDYTGDKLNVSVDGITFKTDTKASTAIADTDNIFVGKMDATTARDFEGYFQALYIFNDTITNTEWDYLYNSGNGRVLEDGGGTPAVDTFTITATNTYTAEALQNLTVYIYNSTDSFYNTTNGGSLVYGNVINGLYDISVYSNQSGEYINRTYTNYDVATDLNAILTPKYYLNSQITYSGNISYHNENYVNNLTYSINYSCYSLNPASLLLYINESIEERQTVSCLNYSVLLNDNYIHSSNGNYSFRYVLNYSSVVKETTNTTFKSDITSPTITLLNFSIYEGFANSNITITLNCSDNYITNLTYNLTYNNVQLFYGNLTNGTITNVTDLTRGLNTVIGKCSDLFSTTTDTYSDTIYGASIILIDEKDNAIFNLDNCSSARVYFDSNSSYYDFKTSNRTSVNFSSTVENKLRVELVYSDGGIITRYIDTELISDELRVCANKEGITHYPQLVISSSNREAIIKNLFSNCYVGADYTRFAYQDSYSLKYYTIPSLYYLYSYDSSGTEILLASIDGSIQGYNNIDTLEFTQQGYNINIQQDDITFQRYTTNSTWIYYLNLANDNTALEFTITRMDTDTVVFTKSDFTNYNNFTLLFDFTNLAGINETTLFKAELTKTNALGTDTIKRYFNTLGEASEFKTEFTFIVALILSIFGLTFTISRLTFSWLGAFIMIVAIGFLSMSPSNMYSNYLMVVDVIILVYIIIVSQQKNYPTLV